jgi:type I restriction enzyme S subunit
MNPDRLLQHFDRIAEAPDAIPRLRRFILDLAVRGKLVDQDPNDEPASELLKRIQAEMARLAKAGEIKTEKPLPTIIESDMLLHLPQGWQWATLGDLSLMVTSGSRDWAQHYSEEGAIFVRMGNLSRGSYILRLDNIQRVTPPKKGEGTRTKLEVGDILISITGEVGLLGLIPPNFGEAYINQHTCMVRLASVIRDRFIPEVLRSPFAQSQFNAPQRGIKNSFRLTDVTELAVPLPPLAEQHRIVAKVDELMALCDQLEAAKTEREQSRDRLVAASLHRLNQPADTEEANTPEAFRDHARFVFNRLPRLTTHPEHIKQLRQTVLNLAVRGKLVSQDPNDEPAIELLKRIQAEKARLVKEEKVRKEDALPLVTEDDQPFRAPDGWHWERLANVSRKIHYGFTASANTAVKTVRLLRITDIQDNSVNWDSVPGCEIANEQVDQFKLEAGDILIARTGGTIGKSFLVSQIPVTAVFASYLIRVQGSTNLYDRYLKLFIESPVYWKQLEDGTRGAGQPNVNGQTLGRMVVPLPPLAEQHRIVAKVDELMALCDELEAQLITTEADSRRLLEAVLHEALAPVLEEAA